MSPREFASPSVSRKKGGRQRWLSAITALTLLISPLSPLLITQPALAAAPAPVQQEGEAVTTLDGVESAVIQIEAEGVFMEPGEGATVSGGTGSGFIIDPEGIAVTNNHVVTGGALFKVYISGQDEPVNAKLLGVSECADLAVIDLEGDGYPFLTWHEGSIKVGLDVYAAGFPLGDPEFTLTRGIIAKAKADGESSWASVDGVLQHDATINPGNSGGPLVDADGAIVGVNYAGDDENNQYFAISKEYAIDIVDTLASGEDLDSLGINGEAFYDEETESSGIYVYSVASGSVADDAGIEAGDIVTSLEGLPLAEDGTMATYCEIIRSHSPDDVMGVEVYRSDTDELLEGQINGRPLETSFSFSEELDPGSAPVAEGEGYTEYVEVNHSDGVFSMELPVEWDDIEENEWIRGEDEEEKTVGIRLDASPNLEDFYDDWGIPGVIARYSDSLPGELTLEELLDSFDYSDICESDGREELSPGYFSGFFDFWKNCDGNEGADAIVLALTPGETNAYYVILEIYTASAADVEASDRILDTFVVYDDQPTDETNMLSSEGELLTDVDTSSLEYDYVQISDPAIVALVPDTYGEVDSSVWTNSDGEAIGRIATIAPNIDDFNNNWTTPGMVIKSAVDLQETLDWDEMLSSEYLTENCEYDDRYETTRDTGEVFFDVQYDIYVNCGGEDNAYGVVVAQSDPPDQIVFIDFVAVTDADTEAFDVLLQSFSIDTALIATSDETMADESAAGSDAEPAVATIPISDDSGTISVRVPESWEDIVSEDWILNEDEGPVGVALTAAPDAQGFNDRWDVPGIFIGVSDDLADRFTPPDVLDAFEFSDTCGYDDRYDYATDSITGAYDIWTECDGETGESFIVFAATPTGEEAPIIFFYMNLVAEEDSSAFSEVLASLAVAGALESVQAQAEEDSLSAATAIVEVDSLNVRSGPGTGYNRVGVARQGDALVVNGQFDSCAWLAVTTEDGAEGWVSGSSQYVTLTARCGELPEVEAPADSGGTGSSDGGTSGGSDGGSASGNATQGCYLVQNQLGAEVTVTITRLDTNKGETFKLAGGAEVEKCLDPGSYTYTLDAPPPWNSVNGELNVQAGDAFLWPIQGE